MSKAKSVFICIFTDKAPNNSDIYVPELLSAPEAGMYEAVSSAAAELSNQEGIEGTVLTMCYAKAPDFKAYLKSVNLSPPFIAIMGVFPDGSKKNYILKSTADVKNYIRAMWTGDFGGTGAPTNPGDADGGWGEGDGGVLCQLFPPLCALGFLPWLALAAITTYKAVESRSTVGRAMWGVPSALFWQGFFARGGVKQIQYWVKKVGIGKIKGINSPT